ncbi:uncharacterized protein CMU_014330 [Cryptosporidium muris RN66]|uniref:DNA-directed RNA polymerase III subunit RPC9 n=1 Tax=Cryptosporidium muris (strain RN66) TaxID=441375 RepID=B6AEZ0_CRYMR|nr:uncharacterized protein CMU_014330 [Cryptosporidium muris RN66]EEA06757.1 hypothetical protein, conserved [Cryptosporidium muris RN66]|eukprot:XP_002141106.1 hypothetical protein [Cryptosporidium muris RN66]
MKADLSSWVPLSCYEVYEHLSKVSDSVDGENINDVKGDDEAYSSTLFLYKSILWYLKAFHDVENMLKYEQTIYDIIQKLYSKFGLAMLEIIQVLDLRPKHLVDLHCSIQNCDKRFSEEDLIEMLDIISQLNFEVSCLDK